MFVSRNSDVFTGDERWQSLQTPSGDRFAWNAKSTYVRKPPYFEGMTMTPPAGRPGRSPVCVPPPPSRCLPPASPTPVPIRLTAGYENDHS